MGLPVYTETELQDNSPVVEKVEVKEEVAAEVKENAEDAFVDCGCSPESEIPE